MIDIILETDIGGDLDDFVALNLILINPNLKLRGLLLTPGSQTQINLVYSLLLHYNEPNIPIGIVSTIAQNSNHEVTPIHIKTLSKCKIPFKSTNVDTEGWILLESLTKKYPNLVLISISPLNNIKQWILHGEAQIGTLYSMGGYIGGENMGTERFRQEFNFGGTRGGIFDIMHSTRIDKKYLISKNITHGIFYTPEFHAHVHQHITKQSNYKLIHAIMDIWLKNHRNNHEGKKMHDPFTICVALDPTLVQFIEVQILKQKDIYGAIPQSGTNIYMTNGNPSHIEKFVYIDEFKKIFLNL